MVRQVRVSGTGVNALSRDPSLYRYKQKSRGTPYERRTRRFR